MSAYVLDIVCRGKVGKDGKDKRHGGNTWRCGSFMRDFEDPNKVILLSSNPVIRNPDGTETRKPSNAVKMEEFDGRQKARLFCPLCKFTWEKNVDDRYHTLIIAKLDELDDGVSELPLCDLAGIFA